MLVIPSSTFSSVIDRFLADRTSAMQYDRLRHHDVVCLSVRPSVTLRIVALKVSVGG